MAKITTVTNPLTGQPAQVDQLDHTAQQIDDAIARALPGGAIDITLQNKADKNIPELLTLPLSVSGYTGSITYRKNQFGMVTVCINAIRLESGDKLPSDIIFATLPEGYRPAETVRVRSNSSWFTDGDVNTWDGCITIGDSGLIRFYAFSGKSTVGTSSCIVSFYV